ncbi:MAG: DUF192 domain-containing protein [Bryobacterales bacterium]|nr:DUF192 domain-containing protein [Bryobacterales bacterium]
MLVRVLIWVTGCLLLAGCGGPETNIDAINLRQIAMPRGEIVQAEVLTRREDMMSGMMFRPPLAADRGLLFVHSRPGRFSYWMHNVKVPLDIIWMDKDHTIVEIAANTPACTETDPVRCPHFGGTEESQFVLELAAGMAGKYGLRKGVKLSF